MMIPVNPTQQQHLGPELHRTLTDIRQTWCEPPEPFLRKVEPKDWDRKHNREKVG